MSICQLVVKASISKVQKPAKQYFSEVFFLTSVLTRQLAYVLLPFRSDCEHILLGISCSNEDVAEHTFDRIVPLKEA